MCGIIGIAGLGIDKKEALALPLEKLTLRGPDDSGIARFSGAILGHTRLAVIDLSDAGHQPMRDDAHQNTIVFNGEIYNYQEVRVDLEKKGHIFASHSDTEVILKAYAEYGEACVEHLDGQFAFAIWDDTDKKLFLARDRFGEKPLYIAQANNILLFASEIKAILATGLVQPEIDPVSIDNYLALLYVPPWRSIYMNIAPLEAGHRAVWQNNKLSTERYWKLIKKPENISLHDAAEQVRKMLTDSVRSRMVADVEVGAFLSGGIDSSIVVRLAQQMSEKKIKTFSGGFEDAINELSFAEEVAELSGTDHTSAQMHDNLLKTFLDVTTYFDEPFADSSNVPTSLISKLAREKVKVALSGDGGDELFWGYGQYTRYNHLPKLQALGNLLTGADAFKFYKQTFLNTFSVSERMKLLKNPSTLEKDPTAHLDYSEAHTPLEKINLTDFYLGLPGDMLTKVDRSSMMRSLEVRSPFLNHKLAQFAYNLPPEYKTDGRRGKIILEKAFGDLLPPGFFTRKKQGFGAPVYEWLHKPEMRAYVEDIFSNEPRVAQHLNINTARSYIKRVYEGDRSVQYKAWVLVALETWFRTRTII